jgi:hypothetical protein
MELIISVDVLGVLDELRSNCVILAFVQTQRIAQQRVKPERDAREVPPLFIALF